MRSSEIRVVFLSVAMSSLLCAATQAQVSTGFFLIKNGAVLNSSADWVLNGTIEDDKSCPTAGYIAGKDCFSYGTQCNCKSNGGAQAGGSGSTPGNTWDGSSIVSFSLTWSFTGQVSPSFVPVGCQTQPCLNVEAIHQLGTCSSISEEHEPCVTISMGEVKSSTGLKGGSLEFAMVTLDPSITPVGTEKTINWSLTINGSSTGTNEAPTGSWKVNDGADANIGIDSGTGEVTGSYTDTSGNVVMASSGALDAGGIMFAAYGSFQASVSTKANPQPAVTFDFDSDVSLELEQLNHSHTTNLTWNFSASIQNP